MSNSYFAQAKEDIHLSNALHNVPSVEGFYIDVGANDPVTDSVTKFFYDQGWRGVNLEPSPVWFPKLEAARPRDINIQAAVFDQPGKVAFYDHDSGGWGTTVRKFARMHQFERKIILNKIEVNTITLEEICNLYAPENIHFLKIDVEGAEGAVLRSMNFSIHRPWILCIESHVPTHTNRQIYEDWDPYVLKAGYHFAYTDLVNRYYVADEHKELIKTFRDR